MSAPRPTSLPGWASGISGYPNSVEPIASRKATGWEAGTAPPSTYQNWLDGLAYGWLNYFDQALHGGAFQVKDDFTGDSVNRGTWQVQGASQPMSIAPLADGTGGAFGAMQIAASTGADFPILSFLANSAFAAATGAFLFEARVRYQTFPSGAGGFVAGLIDAGGAASGVGQALFVATGPSSYWVLEYGDVLPLGVGPTRAGMSALPSPTYQTLRLLRERGQLRAFIDDTERAVVSLPQPVGPRISLSAQHLSATGTTLSWLVDYAAVSAETNRR